jgi:hypothetical protein
MELCDHEEKWADQRLRVTLSRLRGFESMSDDFFIQDYKCALSGKGREITFVPTDQITKLIGPVRNKRVFGKFTSRRVNVGMWGYILYAQLGKLWADGDLRAQGVQTKDMVTLDEEFILPSLPFASVTLGQLGVGEAAAAADAQEYTAALRASRKRAEDAHWTFLRPEPWVQGRAPTMPAPVLPQKRKSEDGNQGRRPKGIKLQGMDVLLSQFTTLDPGQGENNTRE